MSHLMDLKESLEFEKFWLDYPRPHWLDETQWEQVKRVAGLAYFAGGTNAMRVANEKALTGQI